MIVGHIEYPGTYKGLVPHPALKQSLDWLHQEVSQKDDGEYPIQGKDIYAIVSSLATFPREHAVFEAHKEYIDIHFCISGDESIEWAPIQSLGVPKEENSEKDYALFDAPSNTTSIHMTPGVFAIFFPEDGHMPKVKAVSSSVKKVVIKIRASLIS